MQTKDNCIHIEHFFEIQRRTNQARIAELEKYLASARTGEQHQTQTVISLRARIAKLERELRAIRSGKP